MKTITIALAAVLVSGCMRPVPPQPPQPEVIVIPPTPQPKVDFSIPDSSTSLNEEPIESPVETWYTEEAEAKRLQDYQSLTKAIEEAAKKDKCLCMPGDPLCSCL